MTRLPADILARSQPQLRALDARAALLLSLRALGVPCELESVKRAPQATRYLLQPEDGARMRSFDGLERDLMATLEAQTVRIQAPLPGTSLVSVEVSSDERAMVRLGDVIEASQTPLSAAIGVDMDGEPVVLDIEAAPHVLLAGRSGAGKSVSLHTIIASLLMVNAPSDLEIILIDVKRNEMVLWEDAPHVSSITYDPDDAVEILWGAVESMETTYRVLQDYRCRSLPELNAKLSAAGERSVPHRLIVADETADLVMRARGRVESAMVRLGQKGRAAGYHAVLATQSPRATVITGLLKANLPTRIALATSTALDSRIILDRKGAESLLGRGDGLLDNGVDGNLRRFQAAYVSPQEIQSICDHWRRLPAQDTEEMTTV